MNKKGYPTPEEAALAGFTFARVVRVRARDWDCALEPEPGQVEVELATNEPPMEYPYFVHVHREGTSGTRDRVTTDGALPGSSGLGPILKLRAGATEVSIQSEEARMALSQAQARPGSHRSEPSLEVAPKPAALVRWIVSAIGWFTKTSPFSGVIMIALMMAAGWAVTYLGGGTRALPPHWLYFPIFLAAVRFGLKGATATALVATVVAGPLMPGDVSSGIQQSIGGWTYRGLWFVIIGVLMAAIIVQLEESLSKEARLARREAELAAHQAAVLSTVSHEFRSPLSVLLGTARMLSDVEWSGFEATVVEGITKAAERLDDLVAAVLAVSEGPQAIEQKTKEVRLRDICLEVRDSLEYGMRGRVIIDLPDVVLQTKPPVLHGTPPPAREQCVEILAGTFDGPDRRMGHAGRPALHRRAGSRPRAQRGDSFLALSMHSHRRTNRPRAPPAGSASACS